MGWKAVLIVLPLLGGSAWGASAPASQTIVQRDRVAIEENTRAAAGRAVSGLYDQISRQRLAPSLTVGEFLSDLNLEAEFMRGLSRADQVGAPRWIDKTTCQVQLQVSTAHVAEMLKQFAASHSRSAKADVAQIDRATRDWPRGFSATGSSTSADALVEMRPVASERWVAVKPDVRRRALAQANADAASRVLGSVRLVRVSGRQTIGDMMRVPAVRDPVERWLASRPVTRVEFCDSLDVEVQLAVREQELFDVMRTAMQGQRSFATPDDPAEWETVWREFASKVAPAVGRASVADQVQAVQAGVELPAQPPEWADEQLEVVGEARGDIRNKLRTSVAAEADGRKKLFDLVEALTLTDELTVGQAAAKDHRVAAAVERAMEAARLYRIKYDSDGTVTVRLSLDLRAMWEELRR